MRSAGAEPLLIYHLAPLGELRRGVRDGHYTPERLPVDGFVHCAGSPETALAVARDVFGTCAEPLACLEVQIDRLGAPVRWEAPAPLEGAGTEHLATAARFPHVYGPLELVAVRGAALLERTPDGFAWPMRFAALETLLAADAR